MQALSVEQFSAVSGGIWDGEDGFGGDGGFDIPWEPAPIDYGAISGMPSFEATPTVTITGSLSEGISTAISDCANGAEVGALFGAVFGAPIVGGIAGCVINTGIGVIRDMP